MALDQELIMQGGMKEYEGQCKRSEAMLVLLK